MGYQHASLLAVGCDWELNNDATLNYLGNISVINTTQTDTKVSNVVKRNKKAI